MNQPSNARSRRLPTVYTLSNEVAGNQLIAYEAATDGTLTLKGSYPTYGLGTDGGLGNQGALTFNANQFFLYAVNPGSDEISFFCSVA